MKLALLGYGKMGHMIEEAARAPASDTCVIVRWPAPRHTPDVEFCVAYLGADAVIAPSDGDGLPRLEVSCTTGLPASRRAANRRGRRNRSGLRIELRVGVNLMFSSRRTALKCSNASTCPIRL